MLYELCDAILKSKEVKFGDFERIINGIRASNLFTGPLKDTRHVKEEELEGITLKGYLNKDGTEVIEFYYGDNESLINKKKGYELHISNGKLSRVVPIRAYCLNILDCLFIDVNPTSRQYLTEHATSF